MPLCLIGMGANLGDPAETLRAALDALSARPGIELVAASRFLATKPIGGPEGQGEFLNACAMIRTELSPHETIQALLAIEASLGRTRRTRWEARKLDLDLLLYGDRTYREEGVEVPHPRMPSRRFVLDPAEEIAAGMVHPTTGWTIGAIARHLREARNVAMLTGLPGVDRAAIAESLIGRRSGRPFAIELFHDSRNGSFTERRTILRKAFATARPAASYRPVTSVLDFWTGELLLLRDSPAEEASVLPFAKFPERPKLLIDLQVFRGVSERADHWDRILREHAPAPWIRVDASNPEQAATEILAALEAMQG